MDFNALFSLLKGKNAGALKEILSEDGSRRAISNTLSQEDAKVALEKAKSGDVNSAKALISMLMSTPEGKALVSKLLSTLGGKNG